MSDKNVTAASLRADTLLARSGLIVTNVNGVPMIAAHLVEDVMRVQNLAFKSLIRAIEDQGFEVRVDVDGEFTVKPRHD